MSFMLAAAASASGAVTKRYVPALASRLISSWAACEPGALNTKEPTRLENLAGGEWRSTKEYKEIEDPLNGGVFLHVPDTKGAELDPFIANLAGIPKSGLHNAFKNPERYVMYGDITAKLASELRKPDVERYFAELIQRVVPKSFAQCRGEVVVTRKFLENFAGDNVRFLARSFGVPGDHTGQISHGFRFPYGGVGLITPFNFPLEIPVLQVMGALYMGNRPTLHVDQRVSVVMEQFVRLLIHCGMPATDLDWIHGDGPNVEKVLVEGKARSTLFTGSHRVAQHLTSSLGGKVFLEDAGFDWKILGPDVSDVDYVAWQCDQDAYAATGQKCSAQSILFMHENWGRAGLLEKMKEYASKRSLSDLTVGPVLTWSTERIMDHVKAVSSLPGARVLFGGKPLEGHSIPKRYGAVEPTAVFVPLETIVKDQAAFDLCTTELFGPFQIVTEYSDAQLGKVIECTERMDQHLTAAVVSRDVEFVNHVLANTINGTTYAGIRARTTGAPQNHWFGPAGDPRSAGIGTPEAIRLVWSCHREVISDLGPCAPVGSLSQS